MKTIEYIWYESESWKDAFNEYDCNMDVIFQLSDGSKWVTTFYTYQNILSLQKKNRISGEGLYGLYFCTGDMILIDKINPGTVKKVIMDLVHNNDIDICCSLINGI